MPADLYNISRRRYSTKEESPKIVEPESKTPRSLHRNFYNVKKLTVGCISIYKLDVCEGGGGGVCETYIFGGTGWEHK